MKIGSRVLVNINGEYFPGEIISFETRKTGWFFWKKEIEVALILVPLLHKFIWENEYSRMDKIVERSVLNLTKVGDEN